MSNFIRNLGRISGPIMILAGVIFAIIGIMELFSPFGPFGQLGSMDSFNSIGVQTKFWYIFIGLPLIGFGVSICKAAYLKPIANYVADETHDAISTLSSAVMSGRKTSNLSSDHQTVIACHKCNQYNSEGSKYCSSCGVSLVKSKQCTHCNELNDPDASFCDNCGKAVATSEL